MINIRWPPRPNRFSVDENRHSSWSQWFGFRVDRRQTVHSVIFWGYFRFAGDTGITCNMPSMLLIPVARQRHFMDRCLHMSWRAFDEAAEARTAANRPAFLPQTPAFLRPTFFWPRNLPQKRYTLTEPVPKKEIPVEA
jgi:hypothetical protein